MRHRPPYSLPMAGLLCLLTAMLAACAASAPDNEAQASQPTSQTDAAEPSGQQPDTRPPPVQAPPMSDPLPPVRLPDDPDRTREKAPAEPADAPAPVELDFSCDNDADCTVKNVGNCCGYYPKCVNRDSPTDPDAVQAQCAKSGMASVCGFPAITACQCVQGRCESSGGALVPLP